MDGLQTRDIVLSVIGVQFAIPLCKWLADKLLGMVTKRDDRQDSESSALRNAVEQLTERMQSGFESIRSMLASTNSEQRGLQVMVETLQSEVELLRQHQHDHTSAIAELRAKLGGR